MIFTIWFLSCKIRTFEWMKHFDHCQRVEFLSNSLKIQNFDRCKWCGGCQDGGKYVRWKWKWWAIDMWHCEIRMNRNSFKMKQILVENVLWKYVRTDEKWKSFDMVSTCDFGILAIPWNILWCLSLGCNESCKWNLKIVGSEHRDLTSYNAWTNRTKMRTVFEKNKINHSNPVE